ncbi:MAG: CPBP family intramembrane metalloprotease [Elusimicrobia bacterium]|nr:CPBP family intramembrane metalloprotease [Elusimicrobiota bacterium]
MPRVIRLIAIIIVGEYLARHFLLYLFPVIGTLRVNDMLATGLFYIALVWFTAPQSSRSMVRVNEALRGVLRHVRSTQSWLGAAAASAAMLMVVIDGLLWGNMRLPFLVSPWRYDLVLLPGFGRILEGISLLAVNGLVVPLSEERLWRGLIQPQIVNMTGVSRGILATSLLFSVKHTIVDASLARFLALTAFGFVMGVLAHRRGWHASAISHMLANLVATGLSLVYG